MDVRRLGVLRELSERGSVGAVADAMRVTSSAVSQQLKVLEREAGVPLVEPAGRGVALTSAGRELARVATDLAVAIEHAEARWRTFVQQPAGDVTLTTFPTGGEMFLPGLLRRLEGAAVTLVCTDQDSALVDFADLTPDHDVVVADSATTSASWHDRGLRVVPLMTEPLDVALPEDHRLAGRATLSPRDVVGEDWIGVPTDLPFDRILEQIVASTGERVRVRHRFHDNSIVEAMVAAGHGLGILPRFTTRDHVNGLVTRPLVGIRASRQVSALLRPDLFERPSVRLVVQALREEARAVADSHGAV
ncbi:LysR substrate binding domain protein [Aeromicrobium marinum DSM 15272]|uniref:LysR substrate binding domain protein n=1 Tax=Aeromicrobium marinum DSM 15272 TaxID=585531 RepID=E2SC68_9ACTN|nr:LysR family transcriptional regulator [Aeromicrobium marinum]EFQ83354.1 LysR substrate binding domain protein [Aeromicrobium marinum DSM 15272]